MPSPHTDTAPIDSIESLYGALHAPNAQDDYAQKAQLLLALRSWFTHVTHFDPVSGDAHATGMVDCMSDILASMEDESFLKELHDRIYRLVVHTHGAPHDAISAILKRIRHKILREHTMLPVYAVREVDSTTVRWLSRQSGRNLREKLSGKPYIKAVRRKSSVDTAENRLLKAFLKRLESILVARQSIHVGLQQELCENLLLLLQRWFTSDDAAEIGIWENLPPNNTLLQDKRYRKIWDAWIWLQDIDEAIKRDVARMRADILTVIAWNTLALLHKNKCLRMVQQPVCCDYNNFFIHPSLSPAGEVVLEAVLVFDDGHDDKSTAHTVPITLQISPSICHIDINQKRLSLSVNDTSLLVQDGHKIVVTLPLSPKILQSVPNTLCAHIVPKSMQGLESHIMPQCPLESVVIDLCSIRPRYLTHLGEHKRIPWRLVQQRWRLAESDSMELDCGATRALYFHEDISTISMQSLFLENAELSSAVKSSAAMFFAKKLHSYLNTSKLTYLLPDWGNAFDIESVIRSINFYFEEAKPLPLSMAAVFTWHASADFDRRRVVHNDRVLVVDMNDTGIAITPIKAIYNDKLHTTLPQSHGICWERHPVFFVEDSRAGEYAAEVLDRAECPAGDELLQVFSSRELAYEGGRMSLITNNTWHHLSYNLRKDLHHQNTSRKIRQNVIKACLEAIQWDATKQRIFLVLTDDVMSDNACQRAYTCIKLRHSLLEGAHMLQTWQDLAGDISLWRDHLPPLSIKVPRDGRYGDFYLVKDATVTPQRGKAVPIPVKDAFTLPAGKEYYTFPLQQGEAKKRLQFEAYLKSSAFPLEKDVTCKLQVTYTYGADNPYELKFIPLHAKAAGFTSLRVEWRPTSIKAPINLDELPMPGFPPHTPWSAFHSFPSKDGKDTRSLFDWCERGLTPLEQAESCNKEKILQERYAHRKEGTFDWGKMDTNNTFCCWINVNGKSIFCHSANFLEEPPASDLVHGQSVYLDVGTNDKGRNISFSEKFPKQYRDELEQYISVRCDKTIEYIQKQLYNVRFPVLTMWNHGNSLADMDVPETFRHAVHAKINLALALIKEAYIPRPLRDELCFFLCCLHKDVPSDMVNYLRTVVRDKDTLRKYHRHIAFAIGSAELAWQQDLLANIINPTDDEGLTRSITLEVLAIAFWRSPKLVHTLSPCDLESLLHKLYGCIEFDIKKLKKQGTEWQIATLGKHFELLLALLRSRGHEDPTFKTILAPHEKLAQRYLDLLDAATTVLNKNNIRLTSRISLDIEKPESFHKTPNLLYALHMYLSGESSANTISITSVRDE